jgi:hypothetical protein
MLILKKRSSQWKSVETHVHHLIVLQNQEKENQLVRIRIVAVKSYRRVVDLVIAAVPPEM